MRARLAVAASGRICELREVVLRNKPQALLDASPKATVPVLVDVDGTVVDQSLDIMLWALRHNDPGGWLSPAGEKCKDMFALIAYCDGPFKQALDRYKYPARYDTVDGRPERDQAAQWLLGLNERLENQRFLFGPMQVLADMAIAPFVRQYAHTDMPWFQEQAWPALQRWLNDFKSSALFEQVMHKYSPWQPGAPIRRFPGE